MSSGKQTLPQAPFLTTGTPQPEHYVGSSLICSKDVWPGTPIYYLTRTSLKLNAVGQKIPGIIFANVFDCDFSGKKVNPDGSNSDVVALYVQASGDASTGCHVFAFNTVVSKNGNAMQTSAEFDVNNSYADEDPNTPTAPSAGVVISAGGTYHPFVALIFGCNSPSVAWHRIFQATDCWDYMGITLRPTVSNPAGYITCIAGVDNLNPTVPVILLQSATPTFKSLFTLQKNGHILLDSVASPSKVCWIGNASGTGGGIFFINNTTDSKALLSILPNGTFYIYGPLLNTVTDTLIAGSVAGDSVSRFIASVSPNAAFSFGPGNSALDTFLTRTGVGELTIQNTLKVTWLLPATWPADIGTVSSSFRNLYLAGTANAQTVSANAYIAQGSSGVSTSLIVLTPSGDKTLNFVCGLLISAA